MLHSDSLHPQVLSCSFIPVLVICSHFMFLKFTSYFLVFCITCHRFPKSTRVICRGLMASFVLFSMWVVLLLSAEDKTFSACALCFMMFNCFQDVSSFFTDGVISPHVSSLESSSYSLLITNCFSMVAMSSMISIMPCDVHAFVTSMPDGFVFMFLRSPSSSSVVNIHFVNPSTVSASFMMSPHVHNFRPPPQISSFACT